MPSVYDLKPRFQGLLRPFTNYLAAKGVTANQVTLSALFLSVVIGALIVLFADQSGFLLLIPLVMFVRMALNAIDGMLAREHDMKTPFGAVLNELGDVLSDVALYLPFCWIAGLSPVLVVTVVLLAVISEMTGVIAVQIGASRRYDGPMGKSDRAFVFGLLALLIGVGINPEAWGNWLLALVVVLLVITISNRIRRALEEAS